MAQIEAFDEETANELQNRAVEFIEARNAALDEKRKEKELSAFARNGFGFEIGRRVFDMDAEEADEVLYPDRPLS